jgi:peptidoglycan endopeptidase LytF
MIKNTISLLALALLLVGQAVHAQSKTNSATAAHATISVETIKKVQEELRDKGYYHGKIDGVLGPNTREALRRYQKEEKLSGDGRLTRETADHLGVKTAKGSTVDDHFEQAGEAIEEHYGEAGKSVGKGSKELGHEVKKGEVTEGAKDFGKGVGGFGKEVGKGTAKGAKKVAEGVKDVFDGDADKSKSTEPDADTAKPQSTHPQAQSKDSVAKAQQVLKDKGYYTGSIDGLTGPGTHSALKRFQEKEGLTPTGTLNDETMKKLGID